MALRASNAVMALVMQPPKVMNQKALNTVSMGDGNRRSSTARFSTWTYSLSRISGISLYDLMTMLAWS